jgi:hypothetical protein
MNKPEVVRSESDGTIHLRAEVAKESGPDIKYMPEWKAFGWFTALDRVEWDVDVKSAGKFDVYLDWSVADDSAGKPFLFKAGDQRSVVKLARLVRGLPTGMRR